MYESIADLNWNGEPYGSTVVTVRDVLVTVGRRREQEHCPHLRRWRRRRSLADVRHRRRHQLRASGTSSPPPVVRFNCQLMTGQQRSLTSSCLVFLQLPKIMELVGLGYTGWFVYRYLLFKVRCGSTVAVNHL
jgi:hypothetical protein